METNECGQFVKLNDTLSIFPGFIEIIVMLYTYFRTLPLKKIPIVKVNTPHTHTHTQQGDFSSGPQVQISSFSAGGAASIAGQGAKIPRATWQNIK